MVIDALIADLWFGPYAVIMLTAVAVALLGLAWLVRRAWCAPLLAAAVVTEILACYVLMLVTSAHAAVGMALIVLTALTLRAFIAVPPERASDDLEREKQLALFADEPEARPAPPLRGDERY